MSLPTIPDITPDIDITREDVITLLLASVAMEEMGLAHILNAESEKIRHAVEQSECGNISLCQLQEINKNAQQMVDAITRLEMLLQMKIENIMSFTCTQSCTTCTHTTCTRTTCTHTTCTRTTCTRTTCTRTKTFTTCSTTCTRSFTTCCRRPCAITGQAEGLITNAIGEIQGTAAVKCRVALGGTGCPNFLQYNAQPALGCGTNALRVSAMPRTLTVEYVCPPRLRPTEEYPNQIVIKGQGIYSDTVIPESVSQVVVHFTLWIVDCGSFQRFRMNFHSPNYNLGHNSRFINAPACAFTIRCPG